MEKNIRDYGPVLMILAVIFLMSSILPIISFNEKEGVSCTLEVKICPDGTEVGRNPELNCAFDSCPGETRRQYISNDTDECKTLLFQCTPGKKAFFDNSGCGCEPSDELGSNFCTEESRNVDGCAQIYQPVCGWFDPEKTQCVKYPCALTFGNSCSACMDDNVLYWTVGECPSG